MVLTLVNRLPEAAGLIPGPWDKLAHAAIFAVLALAFGKGLGSTWQALLILLGFALFDEGQQFYLSGRHPSLGDLSVDIGAALLTLTWLGKR